MPASQIKLALLMQCAAGLHPGSWLHEDATRGAANSIEYYMAMARLAERGLFDLFFIADTPAARTENLEAWSRYPLFMNTFEPMTLLAAVAGSTRHIGLGGTASTSFTEPYNLARQFASLDHISHGRAAWNVVTSANAYVSLNFGLGALPPHAERYERARDHVAVTRALRKPTRTGPWRKTPAAAGTSTRRSSMCSTTAASTSACTARSTSRVRRRAIR